MTSVFWDSESVIMIDYFNKTRTIPCTINEKYYASDPKWLLDGIRKKRRKTLHRGVCLLQDNAPLHTAQDVVAAVSDCKPGMLSKFILFA